MNIETINKHLDHRRESYMAEDERPTAAHDIKIYVLPDKEGAVRNMHRKHEKMWSDQTGEIKATELRIDLNYDAQQFK